MNALRNVFMTKITRSFTAISLKQHDVKERSLNQIHLIGRVGQDPRVGKAQINMLENEGEEPTEQKDTKKDSGKKVVLFSLATNEYQGLTETGEKKHRVDWHRVCVFAPRLQENVEKYVRQGDRLHITGRIHYNMIRDKAGDERYVTSIIADDVIFLTKLS